MRRKAYSYIRFSTPEQHKGSSLDRQLKASKKFAEENDLELDTSSFRDLGVSGYTGENFKAGLGEFIQAVIAGKIPSDSYLLIENFDRLSRQPPLVSLSKLTEILELGITVVTLMDGRVFTKSSINKDTTQLLLSVVSMMQAHQESEKKSERLKGAWNKKREAVASIGNAKKITSIGPAWLKLNKDTNEWEPIEERVNIIKQIFELHDIGHGQYYIVNLLNKSQTPVFGRGKMWHGSYIQKLVDSEALLGTFQPYHKVNGKRVPYGDPIKNYYPAVIDEDLFYRVKEGRQQRRLNSVGRKGRSLTNLFSTLVKCEDCGNTFGYIDKGYGYTGRFLKCTSKTHGLECINDTKLVYGDLEKSILHHIETIDYTSLFPDTVDETMEAKAVLAGKEAKLKALKKRRALILSDLDDDQALNIASRMMENINELQKEVKKLSRKVANLTSNTGTIEQHINDITKLHQLLDTVEGQELYDLRVRLANEVRKVIKRIDVDVEGALHVIVNTDGGDYGPVIMDFVKGWDSSVEEID